VCACSKIKKTKLESLLIFKRQDEEEEQKVFKNLKVLNRGMIATMGTKEERFSSVSNTTKTPETSSKIRQSTEWWREYQYYQHSIVAMGKAGEGNRSCSRDGGKYSRGNEKKQGEQEMQQGEQEMRHLEIGNAVEGNVVERNIAEG
jgi:hypothetical protein